MRQRRAVVDLRPRLICLLTVRPRRFLVLLLVVTVPRFPQPLRYSDSTPSAPLLAPRCGLPVGAHYVENQQDLFEIKYLLVVKTFADESCWRL